MSDLEANTFAVFRESRWGTWIYTLDLLFSFDLIQNECTSFIENAINIHIFREYNQANIKILERRYNAPNKPETHQKSNRLNFENKEKSEEDNPWVTKGEIEIRFSEDESEDPDRTPAGFHAMSKANLNGLLEEDKHEECIKTLRK